MFSVSLIVYRLRYFDFDFSLPQVLTDCDLPDWFWLLSLIRLFCCSIFLFLVKPFMVVDDFDFQLSNNVKWLGFGLCSS